MRIKALDMERILCLVTDKITSNIIDWWSVKLKSAGFAVTISTSFFDEVQDSLKYLEITINHQHIVKLGLNPRTGHISLGILNLIQTESLEGQTLVLNQALKLLQAKLNTNFQDIVPVIKQTSIAVCIGRYYSNQ